MMLRKIFAYFCAAVGTLLLIPVAIACAVVGGALAIVCAVPVGLGFWFLTIAYCLVGHEFADLTADARVQDRAPSVKGDVTVKVFPTAPSIQPSALDEPFDLRKRQSR
jgi:hypothetical protein